MKDVPEIAPEVRGLIEEIVANPRSHLRLVPRHALLPWIEGGQSVSARELSSDTAARHLVAAHREAVARLLREAAHIAFWKAPVLSHRPMGADGRQYDPAQSEDLWREKAAGRVRATPHPDEGVELLRQCLTSIEPERGLDLGRASQSLAATQEASIAIAEHLKRTQHRTSLRLYERVARHASTPRLSGLGWGGAGCSLSYLKRFDDAIHAYEQARCNWRSAWFCIFNLSCLTGQRARALEAANEIARLWPSDSTEVEEARELFTSWANGLTHEERLAARRTVKDLRDRLPEAAHRIGQAYA